MFDPSYFSLCKKAGYMSYARRESQFFIHTASSSYRII